MGVEEMEGELKREAPDLRSIERVVTATTFLLQKKSFLLPLRGDSLGNWGEIGAPASVAWDGRRSSGALVSKGYDAQFGQLSGLFQGAAPF
jgi:hypothetical protein